MPDPPDPPDQPDLQATATFVAGERRPTTPDAGEPVPPSLPDYDVEGRLGEGGMGVVWLAVQRSTRRKVALKLLSPSLALDERARRRFEREVELASRLEHPAIARVYDAGFHDGVPFFAMQLVPGEPIDEFVRARGLDRTVVLGLMRTICEAVQHAHQRGIIHRDLKPSNLLVDEDRRPHVVDFGLAKATALDDPVVDATLELNLAGTPAFMSPEQAAGRAAAVDTRSDVYSLGVVLHRLLLGASPHELDGSTMEVLHRIATQEIARPAERARASGVRLDRELEAILLKCLALDPDDRYDSAAALADDLDAYLHDRPLLAHPPSPWYLGRKLVRRHRRRVLAAAVVAAAAMLGLAAGGWWLYQRPVYLPIRSDPDGARVRIDGELRPQLGTTPTGVNLGHGRHTIELVHPTHFQRYRRSVRVAWGQIRGDAFEPMVLSPSFREFHFTSTPPGASVEVRDDGGGLVYELRTPASVTLERGRYTVHAARPGEPIPERGKVLEVIGDVLPFTVHADLTATEAPGSPTGP